MAPLPEGHAAPGSIVHPLGPIFYRVRVPRAVWSRLLAGCVFLTAGGLLVLSMRLEPDRSGVGTHRQLGLPPCTLMMLSGVPCPTCGMTTAFAHAVRGHMLASFHAQPAGLIAAVMTMLAAGLSFGVLLTGKTWRVNWYRIPPGRLMWATFGLLIGAWAYKLMGVMWSGEWPLGR